MLLKSGWWARCVPPICDTMMSMSHHPSKRRSRAPRSAGGSASSQSVRTSQRARPTVPRGTDRARSDGRRHHSDRAQGRPGGVGRPGRLNSSIKRKRPGGGGRVLAFLRSPLGVVLGAFLVTLLVGLIALRAAGSSLSGLNGLLSLGQRASEGATSSAPARIRRRGPPWPPRF